MDSAIKIMCITLFVLVACTAIDEKERSLANETKDHVQTPDQNKDYANAITEKYWKLVRLDGQDVVMSENQEREVHFMLKAQENKLTGFSGCNDFFGSYNLEDGNRIHFGYVGATRRACPDVQINEYDFLKVFELIYSYTVSGEVLEFNDEQGAVLAVFQAVYYQ